MGSSLGPVLANIIMTELEKLIINNLITDGTIKFYNRYVDDTLLVIKPEDVPRVHGLLENFDKNLKFTVDHFTNEVPHFLDLQLSPDGISIFRKNTNTGQYVHFNSYVPWHFRISWINSLITRAKRICSPNQLTSEIVKIKQLASWNGFPKKIVDGIINKVLNKTTYHVTQSNTDNQTEEASTIWFRLPYLGDKGNSLAQSCIKKIKQNCIRENQLNLNYFMIL